MLNLNIESSSNIINLVTTKSSNYWTRIQKEKSLQLFHEASRRVPAYKKFLSSNNINPELVNKWEDFQHVPSINKVNYLKKHSLKDLVWDGSMEKPLVFTATSGSSGEPFYFIRDEVLDWQYSVLLEEYIKLGDPEQGPTLVLICFGMGIWIAGLITYKAFELAAKRNHLSLSILTPGINKKDIFNALKRLSPQFKRTILVGYPPFIRDILDEASNNNIDLKKLNLRLLFAAEAISEEFRDFVSKKAFIQDVYKDIMNIYGSADIGAMAVENGICILTKRLAKKKKKLYQSMFSAINKTPTLAQYNPLFINFEAEGAKILLTGNSAIPLIRYEIGDNGGVFTYNEVVKNFNKHDIDLNKQTEMKLLNRSQLPFVYIYERVDFSTSFYGLWIYPEWIRGALLEGPISQYLTGKFILSTSFNNKQDQILEIDLELQKNKKPTIKLRQLTLKKIITHLRSNSSEYREITNQLKKKGYPKLTFWPHEDPMHFRPGTKQKWVQ